MRIREKIMYSHIITSFLPVFFSSLLLIFLTLKNERDNITASLETDLNRIYEHIEEDSDHYQAFSFLSSRFLTSDLENMENLSTSQQLLYQTRLGIDIIEISLSNELMYFNFDDVEYAPYVISDETLQSLWEFLSKPFFPNHSTLQYPEEISNTLVLHNIAFLVDDDQKIGMMISSLPFTTAFLQSLNLNKEDIVVFCQTQNDIIFGDFTLNHNESLKALVSELSCESEVACDRLKSRVGNFYVSKKELYRWNDEPVAYIGFLYGLEGVNDILFFNFWIEAVAMIFALMLALVLSLFMGQRITFPILNLRDRIELFEKSFEAVPAPLVINDEVDMLQKSFSKMSERILNYKENTELYNDRLSDEIERTTRELLNKVRSLTAVNDFSAFIMTFQSQDEELFFTESAKIFVEMFKLNYVSIYDISKTRARFITHHSGDAKISEKSSRMKSIEARFLKKLPYMQRSYSRGIGTLHCYAFPIYYLEKREFTLFFVARKEKFDFIRDTLETSVNLISLKLYSMRLIEEKVQSEKMAGLGQFSSTIVHDIKNPLTVIKGGIEALGDDDFTPEEKLTYIDLVNKELDYLMDMLSEILDFTKGELRLQKKSLYLDELVEKSVKLYRATAKEREVKLTAILKSETSLALDEGRIKRVVGNLLTNALEACEKGDEISIETERKIYDVLIKVSDTGIGIPNEIKDTLFDPFVTMGKSNGTGLGLATAKKIIEAHGGNIEFKSEEAKGTTFFIRLPL